MKTDVALQTLGALVLEGRRMSAFTIDDYPTTLWHHFG